MRAAFEQFKAGCAGMRMQTGKIRFFIQKPAGEEFLEPQKLLPVIHKRGFGIILSTLNGKSQRVIRN